MNEEKREVRTYKIRRKPYLNALNRGKKKGHIPLANLLEKVATVYGNGGEVIFKEKKDAYKKSNRC